MLGCGKGRAGGLPFSAAPPALSAARRTAFFVLPAGAPFCPVCSSPPDRRKFTFSIWIVRHPPISAIPSQMIVKFYCQTLWPQPFTSHVMRYDYELNLELDNSFDKPDKKQVFLSVKGALHSKHK